MLFLLLNDYNYSQSKKYFNTVIAVRSNVMLTKFEISRPGNGTILVDISVTLLQNSTSVSIPLLDIITRQSIKQIQNYAVASIVFQGNFNLNYGEKIEQFVFIFEGVLFYVSKLTNKPVP